MQHLRQQYAQLRLPLLSATALDDPWAPPRSRDAFASAYCNAELTLRDVAPQPGAAPIGHMGYFREAAQPLWEETLAWLQANGRLRDAG